MSKTDAELIDEAYESELQSLFDTYLSSILMNDPGADQHFKNGLKLIRESREKALQLAKDKPC